MRNLVSFVLVACLAVLALTSVGTLAAQQPYQYQPVIAQLLEVSVPSAPIPNPVGAIVVAIGATTTVPQPSCNPCPWPPQPEFVTIVPAFPPVAIGCSSLGGAAQFAQALASGITANSAANSSGYGATASGSRVLIHGPAAAGQSDYRVAVFHGEIHPTYGYELIPALPIVNLCDGIVQNEWGTSNLTGIDIKMVTIPDPAVADFEQTTGFVVPPSWGWDGSGQISVEPNGFLQGPAPIGGFSGFPTSGNFFLRLSTQDPFGNSPLKVSTGFNLSLATPALRFDYRWFNGEGGPSLSQNDTFRAYVNDRNYYESWLIAREDTFTPMGAGVRTCEVDLRHMFWYIADGAPVFLTFTLENRGGNVNDSVVFVDNFRLLPPQLGEGNGSYPGTHLDLHVGTWDPVHWLWWTGAADTKVGSPGVVTTQLSINQYVPQGTTLPCLIMGSYVPYGNQPLAGLAGEPNIIGLDFTTAVLIYSGPWAPGFPTIPFFIPPSAFVPGAGFYVQAAVADAMAPNLRISPLVRVRLE